MVTLMVIKKRDTNTHIKNINNVKSVTNNFKNIQIYGYVKII